MTERQILSDRATRQQIESQSPKGKTKNYGETDSRRKSKTLNNQAGKKQKIKK
jgi:hypothetical protein